MQSATGTNITYVQQVSDRIIAIECIILPLKWLPN